MPPPRKPSIKQEEPKKATVAGHMGKWVPMPEQLFSNPIWSGAPSDAWRVLCWMTNRMTGTVKVEGDDRVFGTVKGNTPVSYKDIATDLHCSWSSVRRSANWLVEKDFLDRKRSAKGEQYRFRVINSIRQFPLETTSSDAEVSKEEIEFLDESKPNTSFLDLCELCGHYDCSGNCDDDDNRPA